MSSCHLFNNVLQNETIIAAMISDSVFKFVHISVKSISILAIVIHPHFLMVPAICRVLQNQAVIVGFYVL